MSIATTSHPALWRVGLWFASLLVAVSLFTGLFCALYSGSPHYWAQALSVVFGITMIFAFPVACLFLPVVIALKDAAKWRLWVLLVSGALIGPVCIALWSTALVLAGRQSVQDAWNGDPLTGMGTPVLMVFALIAGSVTTILYVASLRIAARRARLAAANESSAG